MPDDGSIPGDRDATIDMIVPPDVPGLGFGTPALVDVSDDGNSDDDVTLTGDMLEMYWESDRGPSNDGDVWVSTRTSLSAAWSAPEMVVALSSMSNETSMDISANGLIMYFSSDRGPPNEGSYDVWVAVRSTRTDLWPAPLHVGELSGPSGEYDAQPWSPTVLYLGSDRRPGSGGSDLYRATRAATGLPWNTPVLVPGFDTEAYEGEAFVDSAEGVWFTRYTATDANEDLWYAAKSSAGHAPPVRVVELATPGQENDAWISPDRNTIYFTSDRAGNGNLDIYVATR